MCVVRYQAPGRANCGLLLVWLAKPPFGAKAGPEASGH
ncbi:Multidrug efflux system EmrAB-OMF, inner-membrane proton/drug antiporter EmrB (MFS type) [Pseudomonas orientalis]|nr:Multidrug efflux system EmrAB-OMF, inner-membrane proton/drug antiporter EmrB (MFS type) [Pseudomonas orientalis]